ncbi:hypothetical protein [Telluribacter sp.]|uniref:hypothetical protein n=1 Tax=Telluribacter sp. TaxID=1978767 RepID=UPI002E0E0285|nr:hypothetical protein [Telluribacter sp.]
MATFVSCPSQNQAVNLDCVDTITLIDTNQNQFCIEFYKKIMVQIPTQVASWSFNSRKERDAVYNKLKAKHFSELIDDSDVEQISTWSEKGNRVSNGSNGSNGSYTSGFN